MRTNGRTQPGVAVAHSRESVRRELAEALEERDQDAGHPVILQYQPWHQGIGVSLATPRQAHALSTSNG